MTKVGVIPRENRGYNTYSGDFVFSKSGTGSSRSIVP